VQAPPSAGKPRDWRALAPLALVVLPVVFNLIVLRAELEPAQNLNDSAVHLQMVRWAQDRIEHGQVPLDGWYPYFGLGSPRFHHYQVLPHILTGYVATVLGAGTAYRWILYLLLASWPISVYLGARFLGLGRWQAGASALVSPLVVSAPGLGYEHGSYTWQGYGVWSQLWAMWLLPLTWGVTWRAVGRGTWLAWAALLLGVTMTTHVLAGYLAFLSLAVWVVVVRRDFLRRVLRAALVGAGGLLVSAWLLVPLLADATWTNQSIFLRNKFYRDSFGAPQVLTWLFTGEIYDRGRLPILTLAVAGGLAISVVQFRDRRWRALAGVWLLSLVLFFGRPTLGAIVDLLPAGNDLFLRRFIIGVHLAGIFLAGIALAWLGGTLLRLARSRLPAIRPAAFAAGTTFVAVLVLSPAWLERVEYDSRGARLVDGQVRADLTDGADVAALIQHAKRLGGGRIYAGLRSNWGQTYRVGSVPVFAVLANLDADAVGFTLRTPSLSTDIEALFNETSIDHYDLYNVRYLLLPEGRDPPVEAELLARRGGHGLWRVETSGYLKVVETTTPIEAHRDNLAVQVGQWLRSDLPGRGIHPTVAFEGQPPVPPTIVPGRSFEGPPGRVDSQSALPVEGAFSGRVVANRTAVVLLKSTFDPRWEVVVDGIPSRPQMVAPSYVGVAVPPGPHSVVFSYRPVDAYPLLFLLGGVTLAALGLGPRLAKRRGRAWSGRRRG
jgi:hypothetical protein